MRRVLVVADSFGTDGGSSVAALNRVEYLVSEGFDVTCFCHDPGKLEGADYAQLNIVRFNFLASRWFSIFNISSLVLFIFVLCKKSSKFDLVIVESIVKIISPSVFIGLFFIRVKEIKVYCHDFFYFCPSGLFYDFRSESPCSLKGGGIACIERHCDRDSKASKYAKLLRFFIGNLCLRGLFFWRNRVTKLVFVNEYQSKVIPAPHAFWRSEVDENLVSPDFKRRPLREGSGVRRMRFAFVGRCCSEKGFDLLVENWRGIWGTIDVVGEGPLFDLCRYSPHLCGRGFLAKDKLADFLFYHVDVLLVPSRAKEADGLVIKEAGAMGIPCIVSYHTVPAIRVLKERLGVLADFTDPDSLDRAIKRVSYEKNFYEFKNNCFDFYSRFII